MTLSVAIPQTYSEIVNFLEQRKNYEKTARPRDLNKLTGIRRLLQDLGNPQQSFRVIHIAGTNGKGTTASMVHHLLCKENYRSGKYTSPHLIHIRERILLEKDYISEEAFLQQAIRVLNIAKEYAPTEIMLTFFDLLTAIAFCSFQDYSCEWVILETGLGGTTDSTNVTNKELSILTRIAYDHQNILGESLEQIATEKLGILQKTVPTVIAQQETSLVQWMEQEARKRSELVYCSPTLSLENKAENIWKWDWPDQVSSHVKLERLHIPNTRLECMLTSLLAMQVILPVDEAARLQRIKSLLEYQLVGRLSAHYEVYCHIHKTTFPTMILDGGHNESAIQALNQQLEEWQISCYTLILGIALDKLIPRLKQALLLLCQRARQVLVTQANSTRSATPLQIIEFLKEEVLSSPDHWKIEPNHLQALRRADPQKPLVIAGSFYLLGDMLSYFKFSQSLEVNPLCSN